MDPCEIAGPVLRELLSAHAVLPEQFWDMHSSCGHASGERALMWAVLADGINSYRRNARMTSAQRLADFREAESWIFRTDWNWPFSFVNLCETFGFDPNGVRRALRRCQRTAPRPFRRQRFRPTVLRAA